MSWKSQLKACIQNIDGSKIKKRNVIITCKNAESGRTAQTIIEENISTLAKGWGFNKISDGIGAKKFTVKFNETTGAQNFYDSIIAIREDSSIVADGNVDTRSVTEKIKDSVTGIFGGTEEEELEVSAQIIPEDKGNNTTTIIIVCAAVLLLLIVGVVIWKTRR